MWNGPYGMMGGWDGWGWFWPFHFIIPILFLAIIITAVVMLVRYATGWGGHSMGPADGLEWSGARLVLTLLRNATRAARSNGTNIWRRSETSPDRHV